MKRVKFIEHSYMHLQKVEVRIRMICVVSIYLITFLELVVEHAEMRRAKNMQQY